ncbi:hypothetical protein S245_068341, partial [Arachis hypogaea]
SLIMTRALSKLVTEQNALGLNQIFGNRAERLRIKSDIYLYSSPDIEWSEQKVKLNDVEHKLKDQGRQLK